MGAQQSAARKGVKLRRRAPTMTAVTNDELEKAGVDLALAVAQAEVLEQQRKERRNERRSRGEASGSEASTPSNSGPSSPAHPLSGGFFRGRSHPGAVVELPPWEIVANLSESDWVAFRAWLESGWKCRKCGHVRDDHADHPKAIRLLQQCKVSVPGVRAGTPLSGGAAGLPKAPTSGAPSPGGSHSPATTDRPAIQYASESPEHHVGYLSDSSRSRASSLSASPMHPRAVRRVPSGPAESPRFRGDMEGGPWAAVGSELQQQAKLQQQLQQQQSDSEYGIEACPHLAGIATMGPSLAQQHHQQQLQQQGAVGLARGSTSLRDEHMSAVKRVMQSDMANMSLREGQRRSLDVNELRGGGGGMGGGGSFASLAPFQEDDDGMEPSGAAGQDLSQQMMMMHPSQQVAQSAQQTALQERVLHAITRAHQVYFIDKEPNGTLVFDFLLSALLDCTSSPYGFISSALLKADGSPYLKTHAMSNMAWNKELKAWYAANAHKGLVFTNLNSLHGSIVLSGEPVITNNATEDPRSRGVPPGHPVIKRFFGIPLYTAGELIGIYGLANSPLGYDEALQKELEPLTMTIAQLMYAINERKRRREAELHLSSVVQVAKEGILSLSYSGHITTMNIAAKEIFGLSPKGHRQQRGGGAQTDATPAPLNLRLQDLLPEIDGRTNYLQHGLEHQASGGHVHYGKGRRADGSIFPVEVAISKGAYDTVFYVAVVRDLSEEIELAQRLQDTEDKWQCQMAALDDGVWDWNLTTGAFFFSDTWFSNLGYSPGELQSALDTWDMLLHPADRARAFRCLKDHLDGRTAEYSDEHRLKAKDGSYSWFRHRGRVIRQDSQPPSAAAVGSSAAAAMAAAAAAAAATGAGPVATTTVHFVSSHSAAGEARQLRSAGVSARVATHNLLKLEAEAVVRAGFDIAEPAGSIVRAVQRLKETPPALSEPQAAEVSAIETASQRLRAQADEALMGVGADVHPTVTPDCHLLSVEEVVEVAVVTMEERASAKGLEVVMEVAPDSPLFIVSDPAILLQVIMDLLASAIHTSSSGFVRLTLSAEMAFPAAPPEGSAAAAADASATGDEGSAHGAASAARGLEMHLLITVEGSGGGGGGGGGAKAVEPRTDGLVGSASRLLPLLCGSLSTLTDSRRGAILTASVPVNSHHPDFASAAAAYGATTRKPLTVQEPLMKARVLLVGPSQVTLAALGKHLSAWHVPHSIICAQPGAAVLALHKEGRLPPVVLPAGTEPPSSFGDGTPREGLARLYDVVLLDLSACLSSSSDEDSPDAGALRELAAALVRDRVGVVAVTRALSLKQRRQQQQRQLSAAAGREAEVAELFAGADVENKRLPFILRKPMVRPHILVQVLEAAYRSVPGNESLAVADAQREAGELNALLCRPVGGSAGGGSSSLAAAIGGSAIAVSPLAEPEPLNCRILFAEPNVVDKRALELTWSSRGADVVSVRSASEVMQQLSASAFPFQAIILDCNMPDLGDPCDALLQLREAPAAETARFVAITRPNIPQAETERLLAAGAAACIQRPFSVDDVEGVLRRVVPGWES